MALFRRSSTLAFTAGLLGFGCGGGDGGTPPPPTLTVEKAPTSGDNQPAVNAGQPLPLPFAVLVKENGSPKAGVNVSWAMTAGGGSVSPGTSPTNATGIATTVLTTGSDSVVQRVTATNATLSGSPLTFNATARIQGATQIALEPTNSGNGQTDTVLATLANLYRVILRDEVGAPVQDVVVTWSVPTGQGSVSTTSSLSGASGIASVGRTLGSTAGAQTATATVRGLTGSPVQFTATATAGNAFQIAASGGSGPHTVNSTFPLSAIVRDQHGNPRSGVTVTWAVDPATGSVNPTESTTGTNGIATTTRTLGATPGTYTDTAYASVPQGSPVLFNVTAVAGANVSVINNSFDPASVTIGVGGEVTWTWNSAGTFHNVTFAPATGRPADCGTVSTGTCTRPFSTAGTFNYTCTLHANMNGSVTVQ